MFVSSQSHWAAQWKEGSLHKLSAGSLLSTLWALVIGCKLTYVHLQHTYTHKTTIVPSFFITPCYCVLSFFSSFLHVAPCSMLHNLYICCVYVCVRVFLTINMVHGPTHHHHHHHHQSTLARCAISVTSSFWRAVLHVNTSVRAVSCDDASLFSIDNIPIHIHTHTPKQP